MDLGTLGVTILSIVTTSLSSFGAYIPQFIGGLIILLIGLVLASILKSAVLRLFQFLKVERWFERAGVTKGKPSVWPEILSELVRWTVVILFLIPAVEAWGLPKVTEVLNQFLLYIPNVLVAVVIGFVGLIAAGLVADVVRNAARDLGSDYAAVLSAVARYSIIFFTVLIVLNQLGVAADLIRILFTGIVAMLAIAGGLAFGLGGQDAAKRMIESFRKRIEEKV